MGSPGNEPSRTADEGPQQQITFGHSFAVGRSAVTFAEWNACVAEGGCNAYRPGDYGWGGGKRPVINVSWDDAQAYVKWLSQKTGAPYRLLSDAEREYVTRGCAASCPSTPFWFGAEISPDRSPFPCDGLSGPSRCREARFCRRHSRNQPLESLSLGGGVWSRSTAALRVDHEEIGKRLMGMGHEVTAYCRSYFTPPGNLHNGIRVVRLPTSGPSIWRRWCIRFSARFMFSLSLAMWCTTTRWVQRCSRSFRGWWARKPWSRCRVWTGSARNGEASRRLCCGWERAAVKLPTQTMVVSQVLRKHYKAGYGADTSYVPNGGVLRERRLPEKLWDWGLEPGRVREP